MTLTEYLGFLLVGRLGLKLAYLLAIITFSMSEVASLVSFVRAQMAVDWCACSGKTTP